MTEYLSKKAVLEWLKAERDWYEIGGKEETIEKIIGHIQSGAFDADESEGTWKATSEFAFRLNDQLEAEIQRLRAALERIKEHEMHHYKYKTDVWYMAAEALSTTSEPCVCESIKCECGHHEPTVAERVREIECPFCGCEIKIELKGD